MDKKSNKQHKPSVEIALQEIQAIDILQRLLEYCNDNVFFNFKLWFTMEEHDNLTKGTEQYENH